MYSKNNKLDYHGFINNYAFLEFSGIELGIKETADLLNAIAPEVLDSAEVA